MISTLRIIDLIYLDNIISAKTGLSTKQLNNLTGCDQETTNNVIKKLVKKGYITKRRDKKEILVYPPDPHIQIGIKKVFKLINELNINKEDAFSTKSLQKGED